MATLTPLTKTQAMRACPIVLALLAVVAPTAAQEHDPARLAGVLARFDEVQQTIQTLSAEFAETTHNPMLKEPIVSEGRFFMTKPASIRWEYSKPELMSFVIADDQYTGYYPDRKRAERRNIHRWSEHLFRFIGLGQGVDELSQFYDIELGESEVDGTHLLVLQPKKRRARKRVSEVRLFVDERSFLPRRVTYEAKDGSSRSIVFTEVQVNPHLSASLFRVDLPADVTVTTEFTGLPNLSPGAAQ